nr:methyltransferase domain-containing protein [Actinomycetota bacterium]
LSDISADLVSHAGHLADEVGVADRVSFVEADAQSLRPIEDASVDVVTTRSVLIYVAEKERAFTQFHRVLRPGGRLSIFEPINSYFPDDDSEFWGFDARPVRELVAKIWEYEGWTPSGYPTDPMMNFDERDLVRLAESAGFDEIHLDLVVDVEPGSWAVDWDRLLETSPNPNVHTVREAIAGALTEDEADRFEAHLRPLADAGVGVKRDASAYLWALR